MTTAATPASTRTIVAQLGLAFAMLSLVLAASLSGLVLMIIHWAEDSVAMRHLEANKDYAIAQYVTGASGPLQMDAVTVAYNNPADLPDFVTVEYRQSDELLTEIILPSEEYFFLTSHYQYDGQRHVIYLISVSEGIEITEQQGTLINVAILLATLLLLTFFGLVLLKLSRHLFKPLASLNQQLIRHHGEVDAPFTLPPSAAAEFQQLLQQLNHYRSESARLLKREQAFARYTSHELRTPLTVIKGANSLFKADSPAQFIDKQQRRIATAANQMEETVEGLLSLVRNERHRTLEPYRSLQQLELEQLIEANKPAPLGNPVTISLQVEGEPEIRASRPLWAMVFGNLLRNAIGASSDGNIQVTLTEHSLTVDDDGPGLGEKSADGHGLGLMIVTDICERYGWQFELVNLAQGGCRAELRFSQSKL
ncbi:sensor histidine kinase [Ferrimonas senticii]|uniref:sensor histidine kinase n=1 Tax=Ferrimonas senticii TaxID=394566 RepID=UPI0003F9403E|nr:HAMP domain-containing sensor histidine kinase [Ferrimonas senticii]